MANGTPAKVVTNAGVNRLRYQLQHAIAVRKYGLDSITRPSLRCPSCEKLLYCIATNPEVYATYLVRRCPWCNWNLDQPSKEYLKIVRKCYKVAHKKRASKKGKRG